MNKYILQGRISLFLLILNSMIWHDITLKGSAATKCKNQTNKNKTNKPHHNNKVFPLTYCLLSGPCALGLLCQLDLHCPHLLPPSPCPCRLGVESRYVCDGAGMAAFWIRPPLLRLRQPLLRFVAVHSLSG